LTQAFSSRYFSWSSGDPHRSGFKLHTAVLFVLCVMFQVQLSFVVTITIVVNIFLWSCFQFCITSKLRTALLSVTFTLQSNISYTVCRHVYFLRPHTILPS
jgi:hypothetical protein